MQCRWELSRMLCLSFISWLMLDLQRPRLGHFIPEENITVLNIHVSSGPNIWFSFGTVPYVPNTGPSVFGFWKCSVENLVPAHWLQVFLVIRSLIIIGQNRTFAGLCLCAVQLKYSCCVCNASGPLNSHHMVGSTFQYLQLFPSSVSFIVDVFHSAWKGTWHVTW